MPIRAPEGYLDITNATLRASEIVTTSNVGIANANPTNTLSIGSNVFFEDTSSNAMTVRGNVVAEGIKLGFLQLLPSYDLELTANVGNSISNTVQFTNSTTGFVTSSNVGIGTNAPDGLVDVGTVLKVKFGNLGATAADIIDGYNTVDITESGGTYTYTRDTAANYGNFLPSTALYSPITGRRYRVKLTARSDFTGSIRLENPANGTIVASYDLTTTFTEYEWEFTSIATTMYFRATLTTGTTMQFNAFSMEVLEATANTDIIMGGTRFIKAHDASKNFVAIGPSAGLTSQDSYSVAVGYQAGAFNQGNQSVAVGENAGETSQGGAAVAIGSLAARYNQGLNTVAVGRSAARYSQGTDAVAVGYIAGSNNQGSAAVAVGREVGRYNQGDYAVAVGNEAGLTAQGENSVAVGRNSSRYNQGANAVAVGVSAGETSQGTYTVAVGIDAGRYNQSVNAVAVGYAAGATSQGVSAVAVGVLAGQSYQGTDAVAVGREAGRFNQGVSAVAVGRDAGKTSQGPESVAVGWEAGNLNQGVRCIAMGLFAGNVAQKDYGIALGYLACQTSQGSYAVAVGNQAGRYNQGNNATAMGNQAGHTSQGASAVAVGYLAGSTAQGSYAAAVGYAAGRYNQGTNAVAVGNVAGNNTQGASATAVGREAGQTSQGIGATALGWGAGQTTQGTSAVAVGQVAGQTSQGTFAVAVGREAGQTSQGSYAVAVGYLAGETNQHDNSIVLNASGAALDTAQASSFYVKPVRGGNFAASALAYTSAGEIVEETGVNFDSSGNVGIGTASPSYKLNVLTDTNYDGISLRDSTRELLKIAKGNNGAYINMYDSGASKVNIASSGSSYFTGGNVGIQLSVPVNDFQVRGSGLASSQTAYNNGVCYIESDGTSSSFYTFQVGTGNGRVFGISNTGVAYADGGHGGSQADYAEMFEWLDGNPDAEDRTGLAVAMSGEKIYVANEETPEADIIGIVSANPVVLGNNPMLNWHGRWLRDDLNRYQMEEFEAWTWREEGKTHEPRVVDVNDIDESEVPENAVKITAKRRVLNPQYDPSRENEYIARSERPEWSAVGLLGRLRLRVGQRTRDTWFKIKDISSDVEEWFVR
jgi:hypothetical protein